MKSDLWILFSRIFHWKVKKGQNKGKVTNEGDDAKWFDEIRGFWVFSELVVKPIIMKAESLEKTYVTKSYTGPTKVGVIQKYLFSRESVTDVKVGR